MQRIDENTYIDETLVTCAEYQLFIDEMREQGRYYQPDHWTSFQFPSGQAKEPILGVRHSDAAAFCEWLTQQNGNEWKFRLPNQGEANTFPVKSLEQSSPGYWLEEAKQFIWIGAALKDAFDLENGIDMTVARALTINRVRTCQDALVSDITRAQTSIARAIASVVIYHAHDYALAFERARDLNNTLGDGLANNDELDLVHDSELVIAIARDLNLARDLAHASARDISNSGGLNREAIELIAPYADLATQCASDLYTANASANKLVLAMILARNLARNLDLTRVKAGEINPVSKLEYIIEKRLEIIAERIAGRSPAFEGIRLVKERRR